MIEGPVSFVKAMMDFFGTGENGRKVEISEMKELTPEDRIELREGLIAVGYDVQPLAVAT